MGYLKMPERTAPEVGGFPLPTLMLLGGVALGIVLALICRVLVSLTAKARARAADRELRSGIRQTTQDLVIQPIERELDAYERVREGLATALRRSEEHPSELQPLKRHTYAVFCL